MEFDQKQYYLVNTHQAKNLCEAARIITKMTNEKMRSAILEARACAVHVDHWWNKET